MVNIILCGGVGERLWPLSRTRFPKQFAPLINGQSLLQCTAKRNSPACDRFMVVTNMEQYFLARDQLEEIGISSDFVLEPVGRNTAAAVILACLELSPEEMVLITPSDHHIRKEEAYLEALRSAGQEADSGALVTFGLVPKWAEIGYGYIQSDQGHVLAFKEKPDHVTARQYVENGSFYWNSGMLLCKVADLMEQATIHCPDIVEACRVAWKSGEREGDRLRIRETDMRAIPARSLDVALLEKSQNLHMIAAELDWSDLGSFDALFGAGEANGDGNVLVDALQEGSRLISLNSTGNLVCVENKTVALIDVADIMVVDTHDALLVGRRSASQKVRDVVAILKQENSPLKDLHRTVNRPWGHHTTLFRGEGFVIRMVMVKPTHWMGAHVHQKRNEHWVVVSGVAELHVEESTSLLHENHSTYIPGGVPHRVGNPGPDALLMIEVQSGAYVGEDDLITTNEP